MKAIVKSLLVIYCSLLTACNNDNEVKIKYENPSAVFAGGPVYLTPQSSISELKTSGFGTLINWTIHIHENGDLNFNEEFRLIANGEYVGDSIHTDFVENIRKLDKINSSVRRLEFGLSGAGSPSYSNIKKLVNCSASYCGTGKQSVLYSNFKVLKKTFPTLVAINNDDESEYDFESSLAFHKMLIDIGIKTTIVPYTSKTFWEQLVTELNQYSSGAVDRIYLQAYSGGTGNNPCEWDFGVPIFPGLSSGTDSPEAVGEKMQNWKNECPNTVKGGFIWLYDDFQNSNLPMQYAKGINTVFVE